MNVEAVSGESPVAIDWSQATDLEWQQPKRMRQAWELRAGQLLAITLEWRGPWKLGYVARGPSGEWQVRESIWGKQAVVRAGEASPVAEARQGFMKVKIRRAAGDLVLRSEGWLGTTHVLENLERFRLFQIHRERGLLRTGANVTLEDASRALPDLEPMLILAWALVLAEKRSHAH